MATQWNKTITGAQAVSDVMRNLGFTPPSVISSSTDQIAAHLWSLATEVGQLLLDEHDWQLLSAEHTITTVPGTTEYALPDDWHRYIPDSEWNRTTRLPVVGALKEFEWQALKARNLAGTTFTMLYVVQNGNVVFYEDTDTAQTVVFPYVSRGWVQDGTDYRDNLTSDSQIVLYDPQLFKLALTLAWKDAKGFDLARSQAAYEAQLRAAKGRDTTSRTLSLVNNTGYPYLGYVNIPDSGYGS